MKNLRIANLEQIELDIISPEGQNFLESVCVECRLCIIDTLRIMHHLDENNSGDMTKLVSILRRIASKTGCAILFLHHTSKAATRNDDQTASRGSSVLTDNIRWQAYLKTLNDREKQDFKLEFNHKLYVQFGISKQNYSEPLEPIIYKKESKSVGFVLKRQNINVDIDKNKKGKKHGTNKK